MNFINAFINYLFGFPGSSGRYNPIIPPSVRAKMQALGISESEIIGAFHSSQIKSGNAPGSTMGIANYYGRVVGAIYKKDDKNRNEWVIIGCWVTEKHTKDYLTGRRYGGGKK